MMALLHVILLFNIVTVFHLGQCQNTTSGIAQIEKIYYEKCLKSTGKTTTYDQLRNDVFQMYHYFSSAIELLPDQKERFCGDHRQYMNGLLDKIKEDLNECLSKEEKFVAGFVANSFKQLLHFLCHKHGVYTTRFFSNEATSCRNQLKISNNQELEYCMERIFPPAKQSITQTELCDDITVTKKCFHNLLEKYCHTATDYQNLNNVFFNYISRPCSACLSNSNTILLLAMTILTNFIFFK